MNTDADELAQELNKYGLPPGAGLHALLRHIYANRDAIIGVWKSITTDLEEDLAIMRTAAQDALDVLSSDEGGEVSMLDAVITARRVLENALERTKPLG